MSPGTIYMYYARGGDSLNFSALGEGNAVLIKSAFPFFSGKNAAKALTLMQKLNPPKNISIRIRPLDKLCSGQTLLCKSLGLKVVAWDAKQLDPNKFYVEDIGYKPQKIIQAVRLGIPKGRDDHLLNRFIDYKYVQHATQNPLKKRNAIAGKDYFIIK